MRSRLLRLGLLVAGALATCLAVLWACVVLGLWLALHVTTGIGPGASHRALLIAVVIVLCIDVRAIRWIAANLRTLRDQERQR